MITLRSSVSVNTVLYLFYFLLENTLLNKNRLKSSTIDLGSTGHCFITCTTISCCKVIYLLVKHFLAFVFQEQQIFTFAIQEDFFSPHHWGKRSRSSESRLAFSTNVSNTGLESFPVLIMWYNIVLCLFKERMEWNKLSTDLLSITITAHWVSLFYRV